MTSLPNYVTRVRLEGGADIYSFQAFPGASCVPLPGKPADAEFRAAYSAALVEAISSEPEVDDWSELPRLDDDVHQRSKKGPSSKMKKSHHVPKNWTPEKGSRRAKNAGAAREHEPITIERLERALSSPPISSL
jgi:hypothetical protein